jgi:hypothetical protein
MGNPLFKASDSGRVDILGVSEDITESEFQQVSERGVLTLSEVRPEAFPPGSPMSVFSVFCNSRVDPRPNKGLSG